MNTGQIYFLREDHGTSKNFLDASLDMLERDSPRRSLNIASASIAMVSSETNLWRMDFSKITLWPFRGLGKRTLTRVIPFYWRWGCKNYDHVMAKCLHQTAKSEGGLQYMNEAYALKKDVIGTADMKKELLGMCMPIISQSRSIT